MEKISGIEIFPIISLVIFFLFFCAVLWYVFSVDRSLLNEISEYPLDDESESKLNEV